MKRGRLPAVRVKRGRLPAELFVLAMSLDLDGVLRASGELERAGHIEACFAVMHGFKERNASRMVRVALGNEVKVVASASPRVCILAVGMLQRDLGILAVSDGAVPPALPSGLSLPALHAQPL